MTDAVAVALISGFAVVTGTIPATIMAAAAWRQARANEKVTRAMRVESSNEHKETVKVATAAIAVVAGKVDAQEARVAGKVEETTAKIIDAIAENTAISSNAVAQAERAYTEANSVNEKIAALQREGQQQEQARVNASTGENRRVGDADL